MKNKIEEYDIVLIGAGVISSTLGTLFKLIQPDLKIKILERMETQKLDYAFMNQ